MLPVIFIMLFMHAGFAQYTVTKVIGSVRNKYNNELLKPGSQFKDTSILYFSTNKDMVRAIVAGQGIYIITPSPNAEKQGNNILEIVKFALHIKSKEGNLSGRGEESSLLPEALKTEYNVNEKNIISAENKYLFDANKYNVSTGNKFFLQTEIDGSKPVTKALQTKGDTLILYSADFRKTYDTNAEKVNYKLGFYTKETNSSSLLTPIYPYFDSTEQMETVMKIIIENAAQKEKDKLMEQCYAEVYEALGKPSDITFKKDFEKIYASYQQAALNGK